MHGTALLRWMFWVEQVNLPCHDDGVSFTVNERLKALENLALDAGWRRLADWPLALVLTPPDLREEGGLVLVSSHADSLYPRHFLEDQGKRYWLGSFDNSLTNGVLAGLLSEGRLPPNLLLVFTGGAERENQGARQAAQRLNRDFPGIWERLELVVSADVTASAFGKAPLTIENFFAAKKGPKRSRLHFTGKRQIRTFLLAPFDGREVPALGDDEAGIDESWEYQAHGVNACSICLPAGPHPSQVGLEVDQWMHAETGILVQPKQVEAYAEGLAGFLAAIADQTAWR